MRQLIFVVLLALVVSVAPARAADDSDNGEKGFVSIFFPHITFRGTNQPDTGDGLGFRIGGLTRQVFGAYLSAFRTRHDNANGGNADFTGLTADLKVSVPLFKVVTPYGSAGLGRYVLETPQTVYRGNQEGSGVNGYQVGAGLDIHISEQLVLSAGYTKRRMLFDRGTPVGDEIHQQIREYDLELAVLFR